MFLLHWIGLPLALLFDLLRAAFDHLVCGVGLVDVDAMVGRVAHRTLHGEQAGTIAIGNLHAPR